DVNVAADKAQAGVAHHGTGEEARFAQNLETVADAEHNAAAFGERFYGLHDRRETRDGAGPEIVTVGKSAGQDNGVAAREVLRLVPYELDRFFQDVADSVERVVVAIRARKDYDSKFHGVVAPGGIGETSFYHIQASRSWGASESV